MPTYLYGRDTKIEFMRYPIAFLLTVSCLFSMDIFIFNPESQASKSYLAKKILEKACSAKKISCKVKFFAEAVDFYKVFRISKPDIVIVASYYYRQMKTKLQWESMLKGYNGKRYGFRKMLVTSKKKRRLSDLKYISVVSSGQGKLNPVEDRFIKSLNRRRKVYVNPVSKEIDAIMGLAFAQVDGAIVTPKTFRILRTINPKIVRNLHVLKRLKITPYPQVVLPRYVLKSKKEYLMNLKKIFSLLKKDHQGRLFFRFFGVTSFN